MATKILSFDSKPQDRFIREPERVQITGLSRSVWWNLEKQGRVPKRVRIGPRIVAWRLSDIERWMSEFPNPNLDSNEPSNQAGRS